MNFKRFLAVVVFVLLTLSVITGCNKAKEDVLPDDSILTVESDETEKNATEKETVKVETEVKESENKSETVTGYFNHLTGEKCDKELSTARPLGIMLNNLKAATPQQGISLCDVLYEVRAEGGVTRYLALFLDYANLPETGSVRSSRDYYIDIAMAHDAIYAHCGGSPDAYKALQERFVNNIDGTNDRELLKDTYYRSKIRMQTMAIEHTMMTDGPRLAKAIAAKGYRTEVWEDFTGPFAFAPEKVNLTDGKECDYIHIPYSNYVQAYLEYDKESGLYKKGQYYNTSSSLGKCKAPQIDGNTKEQLAFTNVLILIAKHSETGDEKGRIRVDFVGEGKGYYAVGGKVIDVIWKKPSREETYRLYHADGVTELLINTGKSYVSVAPDDINIFCGKLEDATKK